MIQLTKHFTLEELTRSQTAVRNNIDNTPDQATILKLKYGCRNVLEPIRSYINTVIYITSGYRCKKLNKKIGGSLKSQHCKGEAVDCHAAGLTVRQFAKKIIDSGIIFDQLIVEFDQWVHISWRVTHPRQKLLYAYKQNGKTKYREMRYEELI